jgi:hypothetical protein
VIVEVASDVEPVRDRWRTPEWVIAGIESASGFSRAQWVDLASEPGAVVGGFGFNRATWPCPTTTEEWRAAFVRNPGISASPLWFCNPPYRDIGSWVDRMLCGLYAVLGYATPKAALITPLGLETKWARTLAAHGFVGWVPKGRIAFDPPPGIAPSTPRMPTMIWLRDADRRADDSPFPDALRVLW